MLPSSLLPGLHPPKDLPPVLKRGCAPSRERRSRLNSPLEQVIPVGPDEYRKYLSETPNDKKCYWGTGSPSDFLIRASWSMRIRYDETRRAMKSGPKMSPGMPMIEIPPMMPIIMSTL